MIFSAKATPFLIARHNARIVSAAIIIASFRSLAFIYNWHVGYYFLVSTEPRNDVFFRKLADVNCHISKNDYLPSVTDASKGFY